MPTASRFPSLIGRDVVGCPVCERIDCPGEHPDKPHPKSYPFLPGGYDPMEGVDAVPAGRRVFDPDTGALLYGDSDLIPRDLAERLGLVEPAVDQVEEPSPNGAAPPTTKTRPRPRRETR